MRKQILPLGLMTALVLSAPGFAEELPPLEKEVDHSAKQFQIKKNKGQVGEDSRLQDLLLHSQHTPAESELTPVHVIINEDGEIIGGDLEGLTPATDLQEEKEKKPAPKKVAKPAPKKAPGPQLMKDPNAGKTKKTEKPEEQAGDEATEAAVAEAQKAGEVPAVLNAMPQPDEPAANVKTSTLPPMKQERVGPEAPEIKPAVDKDPEVVYKPLSGIAVFPVLRHGNRKAFGDIPVVFANEFANKLDEKYPKTRVFHPVYSVEELKMRGLDRMYREMMAYYLRAGHPHDRLLNYILSELSPTGEIERVVFVEADMDLHHQTRSWHPKDIIGKIMFDSIPDEQRYYVRSRVKVYDTASPHHPLVWSFSWKHPVKKTGLYNATASVYQDGDSLSIFAEASRMMSRVMLTASPKRAYMEGTTDVGTAVAGQLYGGK